MTRTVGIEFVEKELENIYNVVKKAQQAAVDSVKPEVIANKVDEIARNIITEAGYGEFFTHGLGHGIGIGGEGNVTFTIAGPTGEGLTSARSFARNRRCVLVGGFSIK